MAHVQKTVAIGDKTLLLDTGKMAKFANGAVMISMGGTSVLCTTVSGLTNKVGAQFFPLSCDYFEKFYAAGRIPGSYFKREARQAEHEILASRLIDRPCRPLFPEGFQADTQVTATVVSYDKDCDPVVLARAHGSVLFTRGETQSLVAVTLGTGHDSQRIETLNGMEERRFLLHYNFPPFSTGEVKPLRGPGRREIGHGALAWRGISPALPSFEMFPYILRSVSEILESNGSSSMATVCGTSLAMMDAGVPISSAVAGIAMGLVSDGDNFAVLSDILGDEDHFGDMDFKVVGSAEGISALQMDIKIDGLSRPILEAALEQAKAGRLHILGEMNKAISTWRPELSAYAPRIFTILINPERIKDLIGPGGKNIKSIVALTGAQVDVEEDGTVRVAAIDGDVADAAINMVRGFTSEAEVGKDYDGVVTRIADFGAFVRIMPGTEGLVHISELAEGRVERVEDVCKLGDALKVRVINVDRMGKIRLSRREALGLPPRPAREDGERSGGGGGGPGGDRGPRRDGPRTDAPRSDRGPAQGAAEGGHGERSDAANERRARRDRPEGGETPAGE